MDKISKNIIYLLSLNSRVSVSELAKKLLISRKIVEHRVKELYSNDYIKPLLIYNYQGLIKATILIKLTKFDSRIIEAINKTKQFVKVKETLGQYDLSLLIIVENNEKLEYIINRLNILFHENIQNMDILFHEKEDTLGYKFFCSKPEFFSDYSILYYYDHALTEDDKKIISILKEKPNIKFSELTKITKWDYLKIKRILSNFSDKRIIRFSVDPNYDKLDLEFHNVLIKINPAKYAEFEKYVINNPQIHWIKKGTGKFDYVLSIVSKNVGELVDITRQIRTDNKEIIFDFTVLISKINIMRKF